MSDAVAADPAAAEPPAEPPAELATLRAIAARGQLGAEWAVTQLDAGATERAARDAALEAVAACVPRRPAMTIPSAGPSLDNPAVRLTAMQGALAARMGAPAPGPTDPARHFMGLTAAGMMREELAARGRRDAHRLSGEALIRAPMSSGILTTSDFPVLLTGAGSRVLAAAYVAAQSPLRRIAAERFVPDFRTYTTASAVGFPALELVPEHAELRHGALAVSVETSKVETFGRKLVLSRQALIDDDLGMFSRAANAAGAAAAAAEARELIRLLLGNDGAWTGPTMSDGARLISSAHGNLGGVGTATLNAANFNAARAAMRGQGRPLVLLLTEGQASDHRGAALMLHKLLPARELIADRGYDSGRFRAELSARGIATCIPSTRSRKLPIPHDAVVYRQRHRIEIMFGRLKDLRRIAMRYDRCAHTFFSAITLAASVIFWLGQ